MSKLDEYEEKRDFRKTPEPKAEGDGGKDERFVIQKHAASSLHYDFRLEHDGVLKSWAVPKGPSTDPSDKRLAVMTEDHPLGYADFEGVIPEGEYGAGTVIVWDSGTYENRTRKDDDQLKPVDEALEDGHLVVYLHGEKLRGGYALQHTGWHSENDWLLIKVDDEEADARRNPVSTEPGSVKSGRTIEEVAEEEGD
jgi:DNA ligase D-like protein (predicted 3'-phosphoesterase)